MSHHYIGDVVTFYLQEVDKYTYQAKATPQRFVVTAVSSDGAILGMQPFVGYAEDGLPVAVVDDDSAIRIRLTAAFQGPSK